MYQDCINKILAEKLNVFVIVYLDNILIYTKSKSKKAQESYLIDVKVAGKTFAVY